MLSSVPTTARDRSAISPAPDKKQLRQFGKEARDALSLMVRSAAKSRFTAHFAQLLPQLGGEPLRVATYAAIGSEPDLSQLTTVLRGIGWDTVYPKVNSALRQLEFYSVTAESELCKSGPYEIPEPSAEKQPVSIETIDIFFVPALAVSLDGDRVGYGAGYYDEALSRAPAALRVCFVFEQQIVPTIPVAAHDQKLDILLRCDSGPRQIEPCRVPLGRSK